MLFILSQKPCQHRDAYKWIIQEEVWKKMPSFHNNLICSLHFDWSNTPELRGCQLCSSPRYRRKSFIDYKADDTCATADGRFISGVQFGLKSYVWFQNWTCTQLDFDLNLQLWCQTKIAGHEVHLPLNYISMFYRLGRQEYFINAVHGLLKEEDRKCSSVASILYAKQKKMQFKAQNSVVCE